jgi:hypothetical protein
VAALRVFPSNISSPTVNSLLFGIEHRARWDIFL